MNVKSALVAGALLACALATGTTSSGMDGLNTTITAAPCTAYDPRFAAQCAKETTKADCQAQVACHWLGSNTSECYSKTGDRVLDQKCQQFMEDACMKQIGCVWRTPGDATAWMTAIHTDVKMLLTSMPQLPLNLAVGPVTILKSSHDAEQVITKDVSGIIDAWVSKYGLPAQAKNSLLALTVTESVQFRSFHVTLPYASGVLEEVVGGGRNWGGIVYLAFVYVLASAPVTAYHVTSGSTPCGCGYPLNCPHGVQCGIPGVKCGSGAFGGGKISAAPVTCAKRQVNGNDVAVITQVLKGGVSARIDGEARLLAAQIHAPYDPHSISTPEATVSLAALEKMPLGWCDCFSGGGDVNACSGHAGFFEVGGSAQTWTNIKCCRPCYAGLDRTLDDPSDLGLAAALKDLRATHLTTCDCFNGGGDVNACERKAGFFQVGGSAQTWTNVKCCRACYASRPKSPIPAVNSLRQLPLGWCDCFDGGGDVMACGRKAGFYEVGGSAQTWTRLRCCRPCYGSHSDQVVV